MAARDMDGAVIVDFNPAETDSNRHQRARSCNCVAVGGCVGPTPAVLITNVMSALGTDFVARVGEHSSQFLCDGGVPHDRAISDY